MRAGVLRLRPEIRRPRTPRRFLSLSSCFLLELTDPTNIFLHFPWKSLTCCGLVLGIGGRMESLFHGFALCMRGISLFPPGLCITHSQLTWGGPICVGIGLRLVVFSTPLTPLA